MRTKKKWKKQEEMRFRIDNDLIQLARYNMVVCMGIELKSR